jgi:hypothetical protein
MAATLALLCPASVAHAATPQPAVPIIVGATLHNFNVSQSMAYDPMYNVWVFAQLHQGHPAAAGDLTLTLLSAAGADIGHMYLNGFGHGVSISVERQGTALYVWTETLAQPELAHGSWIAGTYGTKLARFPWTYSATLTPTTAGVVTYAGGSTVIETTPSLDAANDAIGMHYYSTSSQLWTYIIYRLSDFRSHVYTVLAWFHEPAEVGIFQGWVLDGSVIYRLDQVGTAATITTMDLVGAVLDAGDWPVASTITPGEPEGITTISGNVCANVAGGASSTNHSVNLYCVSAL